MAKDKTANPNQAQGRESAPGQNKVRQFVNEAGDIVEGTMNDFHATLKDQGYRPIEEADAEEAPAAEEPA